MNGKAQSCLLCMETMTRRGHHHSRYPAPSPSAQKYHPMCRSRSQSLRDIHILSHIVPFSRFPAVSQKGCLKRAVLRHSRALKGFLGEGFTCALAYDRVRSLLKSTQYLLSSDRCTAFETLTLVPLYPPEHTSEFPRSIESEDVPLVWVNHGLYRVHHLLLNDNQLLRASPKNPAASLCNHQSS